MASGRTISASFLTDLDSGIIDLCETISESIGEAIPSKKPSKNYWDLPPLGPLPARKGGIKASYFCDR